MVMDVINLRPLLSLQVHIYPECSEEVRPHYKSTAAERRMRNRQWELFHCSIHCLQCAAIRHVRVQTATIFRCRKLTKFSQKKKDRRKKTGTIHRGRQDPDSIWIDVQPNGLRTSDLGCSKAIKSSTLTAA